MPLRIAQIHMTCPQAHRGHPEPDLMNLPVIQDGIQAGIRGDIQGEIRDVTVIGGMSGIIVRANWVRRRSEEHGTSRCKN